MNQFTFCQTKTSVISMLNLSSQMFVNERSTAARNTALSQLLVVVSDGRGIFHEGREKVYQVKYLLVYIVVLFNSQFTGR